MKRTTWSAALVFGALLIASGASAIDAQSGEAPQAVRSEVDEIDGTVPAQDCDTSAGPALVDLQANATPVSSGSGTFYVCLSNDFFCGGPCPDGLHCATEACGSMLRPACTFEAACVGGCQVTPTCFSIAQSCDF